MIIRVTLHASGALQNAGLVALPREQVFIGTKIPTRQQGRWDFQRTHRDLGGQRIVDTTDNWGEEKLEQMTECKKSVAMLKMFEKGRLSP